jgi:hypothetical protein
MKNLFFVPIFIILSMYVAAQPNTYEVKSIEGEIVAYSWRTGYQYTRIESAEKGSETRTTYTLGNHCFVLLKNTTGLELNKIRQISSSFINGEPADRISALVDIDNHMYIRVSLDKQPNWNIGDKLLLDNCVVSFDEYGSGLKVGNIRVIKHK